MADEIAELRERLEYYRHRSVSVPLRPIAAAYADAADEVEEIIGRLGLQRSLGVNRRKDGPPQKSDRELWAKPLF